MQLQTRSLLFITHVEITLKVRFVHRRIRAVRAGRSVSGPADGQTDQEGVEANQPRPVAQISVIKGVLVFVQTGHISLTTFVFISVHADVCVCEEQTHTEESGGSFSASP